MSARSRVIPTEQHSEIVRALYGDAEAMGWEGMSLNDRSTQYDTWVSDASVGAILTRYMTPEQARSWIKDGPMKEYARARRGTGRFRDFGMTGGTSATEIVVAALGPEWAVVTGSEGTKPSHCTASRAASSEQAFVAWGSPNNFRHLVWSALRHSVVEGVQAHIVVTSASNVAASREETLVRERIGARCDLSITHITERVGTSPSSEARPVP